MKSQWSVQDQNSLNNPTFVQIIKEKKGKNILDDLTRNKVILPRIEMSTNVLNDV